MEEHHNSTTYTTFAESQNDLSIRAEQDLHGIRPGYQKKGRGRDLLHGNNVSWWISSVYIREGVGRFWTLVYDLLGK